MNLQYSVSAVYTLFEVLGISYCIYAGLVLLSVGSQIHMVQVGACRKALCYGMHKAARTAEWG